MILILVLLICIPGVLILQFGFVFILLVLMPTIVAFFTDTDLKRSIFKVVGCGNLAAALPTLVPMVKGGLHLKHYNSEEAISDPKVWMFIYLGAAAGWGVIFLCRNVSRLVVTLTYQFNISSLQQKQKKLIEEWGEEITESAAEEISEENTDDSPY